MGYPVIAQPATAISWQLGLAVKVAMCSPNYGTSDYDGTNQEVTALQLNHDQISATWGEVLRAGQVKFGVFDREGNVVVIREDVGVVPTVDMDALCQYC